MFEVAMTDIKQRLERALIASGCKYPINVIALFQDFIDERIYQSSSAHIRQELAKLAQPP
jgi:hypothetical protein